MATSDPIMNEFIKLANECCVSKNLAKQHQKYIDERSRNAAEVRKRKKAEVQENTRNFLNQKFMGKFNMDRTRRR